MGLDIDTVNGLISLPRSKVRQITSFADELLSTDTLKLRDIARILGKFSWASIAVANAQAHCCGMQGMYIAKYARAKNPDCSVPRSEAVKSDLSWWRENLPLRNGNHLWQEEPSIIIYSDASLSAGDQSDKSTGGPWTAEERTRHINVLELEASWLALRSFAGSMKGVTIEICFDSFAAGSYINHKVGTISKHLNAIALQMVNWSE